MHLGYVSLTVITCKLYFSLLDLPKQCDKFEIEFLLLSLFLLRG